jgi:glycosyltransferase involved in cell wall biosynthesis
MGRKTIGRIVLQAERHADAVVVCDDGSADTTAEIAEGLGAVVLRHLWGEGEQPTPEPLRELDAP